jgi:hypothetical protein
MELSLNLSAQMAPERVDTAETETVERIKRASAHGRSHSTAMSINTELFQKIYDQISQHPETHDQGDFESRPPGCGTTRCVAGWAIALHCGVNSIYSRPGLPLAGRETSSGYLSPTAVEAADLLGLTDRQAVELFYNFENEEAVELCHRYATKGDDATLDVTDE